jgi:hypothetical protein
MHTCQFFFSSNCKVQKMRMLQNAAAQLAEVQQQAVNHFWELLEDLVNPVANGRQPLAA